MALMEAGSPGSPSGGRIPIGDFFCPFPDIVLHSNAPLKKCRENSFAPASEGGRIGGGTMISKATVD